MPSTTTLIIGAGQAGLAMSRCLTERSIDHVLLERGEVANAWLTERWDSLRLLTPNWMTRLPGHRYDGPDADGFMTAGQTADFLRGYGRSIEAPVHAGVSVDRVEPRGHGFHVATSEGDWAAQSVVVATGACRRPNIPGFATDLPGRIQQLSPTEYRNPAQVEPGRVLVVGASASGAQIADELARAGRDVTIAVGSHVRLPRRYRGMDIHWWMDAVGLLDESWLDVGDLARVRRLPSLQLVGSPDHRTLDLNALRASGVQIAGRLAGITANAVQFSGSLANAIAGADLKLDRLLLELDRQATSLHLDGELPEPERLPRTVVGDGPLGLPLAEIGAVVWATGFRPHHPELPDHVKDRKGALRHDGGVVDHPGLYALGLPFLRRRKSTFIDGVGPDAQALAGHIHTHLDATRRIPALA